MKNRRIALSYLYR